MKSWIHHLVSILVALLFFAHSLNSEERQAHGYKFEDWVIKTFFNNHISKYTDKWDVPAGKTNSLVSQSLSKYPVSIKVVKYGQSIGFGDALRQREIDEDFLLIAGIWDVENGQKFWKSAIVKVFSNKEWQELWFPVRKSDLQSFDHLIKDRSLELEWIRKQAKLIKKEKPFSLSSIQLNPKIGHSGQRRLQCSIQNKIYQKWQSENPEIWNITIPDHLLH